MAKLKFILEDGETVEVDLLQDITIGRLEENDVVVNDPRISSRHAEVRRALCGGFEVRDLASKAGTTVNGEIVDRKVLVHGDRVTFGPLSGVFEFEIFEISVSAAPPPAPAASPALTSRNALASSFGQRKPDAAVRTETGKVLTLPKPAPLPPAAETLRPSPVAPQPQPQPMTARAAPPPRDARPPLSVSRMSLPPAPARPVPSPAPDARGRTEPEIKAAEAVLLVAVEELRQTKAQLEAEVQQVRQTLAPLAHDHHDLSQRCKEMKSAVAAEQRRFENLHHELQSAEKQFRDISAEMHTRTQRLMELRAEEERCSDVTAALEEAETRHAALMAALALTAAEHAAKHEEVQQFTQATGNAVRDLENLTAGKEQVFTHLLELAKEQETFEIQLSTIHHRTLEEERKAEALLELVEAREDQVRAAERKLQSLEQKRGAAEQLLQSLAETEERLKKTTAETQAAEASHTAMIAALAILATRHQAAEEQAESREQQLAGIESAHAERMADHAAQQRDAEAKLAELQQAIRDEQQALAQHREEIEVTRRQMEADAEVAHDRLLAARRKLEADVQTMRDEAEAVRAEKAAIAEGLAARQQERDAETQRLEELRAQRTALESECQQFVEASSKKDEVASALQELEARHLALVATVAEVTGRLSETQSQIQDADQKSAALAEELAARQKERDAETQRLEELRAQRTALESECQQFVEASSKKDEVASALQELETRHLALVATVAEVTGRLSETQSQIQDADQKSAALAEELAARQKERDAETQRLEELRAQRTALESECQQLAETSRRKDEVASALLETETKHIALVALVAEVTGRLNTAKSTLQLVDQDEAGAKKRLEVLLAREKELQTALEGLTTQEQSARGRFEEIRGLADEAESGHVARMSELHRTADTASRELAALQSNLAPLVQWKDEMDRRYKRLATLAADSTDAQTLWKEIEAEKENLRHLILNAGNGPQGVTMGVGALRGAKQQPGGAPAHAAEAPDSPPTERGSKTTRKHGPMSAHEAQATEDRNLIGLVASGGLMSSARQEMALNARLRSLQDSVKREATLLEFLREERAREERRARVVPVPEQAVPQKRGR